MLNQKGVVRHTENSEQQEQGDKRTAIVLQDLEEVSWKNGGGIHSLMNAAGSCTQATETFIASTRD
jgi:hypothetical protein